MKKIHKERVRMDLLYALIAFEAILVAIASVLWWPTILIGVAITAFVFSLIGLVSSVRKKRKDCYSEEKGRWNYRFPVARFILWALLLIGLTSVVVLFSLSLYVWAIVLLVVFLLVCSIIGVIVGAAKGKPALYVLSAILALLLSIAVISYAIGLGFYHGVFPMIRDYYEQNENDEKVPDTDAPVEDPCKDGHEYENGKCTVCDAEDPDYQAPVEDPCKDGHKYENGKCTVCDAEDPDYQAPVEDPCKDGHKYDNGKCTVCGAEDPDYQAPVEDPCKDGHKYENGKCTVCEKVEPKFIDVPETMSYGKPVHIKLQGIDADNLKYGNEDFISIVKVSDSEVVLTLVGIVNDAGQVEIVPASGYITVTDSVTGTNISISVVD